MRLTHELEARLVDILQRWQREGLIDRDPLPAVVVTHAHHHRPGDLCTTLALQLASRCRQPAGTLATALIDALPAHPEIAQVAVAAPGFINFSRTPASRARVVIEVLDQGAAYGCAPRPLVHPPSVVTQTAPMSGPLRARHGRAQVLAEVLPRVLMAAGATVMDCSAANRDACPDTLSAGYDHVICRWPAGPSPSESVTRDVLVVPQARYRRGGHALPARGCHDRFVTWRQMECQIGKDAARYFHLMRPFTQPMTVDLDLACRADVDNPLYHVQYAHARIGSVLRRHRRRGGRVDHPPDRDALARLEAPGETGLLALLAMWPAVLQRSAQEREPHRMTNYLRDLAHALHTYYSPDSTRYADTPPGRARIALLQAVRQVLVNGTSLIGVSTPEVV